MRHVPARSIVAILVVGGVTVLAACGAGKPPARGGGDIEPITLTATSYDGPGRTGAATLAAFAHRAAELSNGAVEIEVGTPPDSSVQDTSAEKITEIRKGSYDLGIVATRSFGALGVRAFEALQAPFLVTSNALGDAILSDRLAQEMLGGTDAIGLRGLALTFDSRRFPIGFKHPLVSLDDFAGATIAARPNDTTYALLRALGATPSPINGGALSAAAAAGAVAGSEGIVGENVPVHPVIVTANEPWYFKTNAIVANAKVFDGLSEAQQDVLRTAAAAARSFAAQRHGDDYTEASDYCARGHGPLVIATDEQLAQLRRAVRPVIASMERDPFTRRAITRIRELGAGTHPPILAPCMPTVTQAPVTTITARGDQSVLDGDWRLNSTYESLTADGVPSDWAGANFGVWTFHLKGGKGTVDQPRGGPCIVSYVLAGNRMSFNFAADPASECGGFLRGTFSVSGDVATFHWAHQDELGGNPVAWDNAFWKGGLHRIGSAE
jgi:TRAP-type C4-dicarboxylate transport system substrate-binding protein